MSKNPFRYFKTSPEIMHLAVLMYVRFPLSLRNIEDLLHECSIDVCHEVSASGSIGSARTSLTRSGNSGQRRCGEARNGSGPWTRLS